MNGLRVLPAMTGAVLATFGLFWLMQQMVLNDGTGLRDAPEVPTIEFVRLDRDPTKPPPKKQRRLPDKPPERKAKPQTPRPKMARPQRPQPQLVSPKMPRLNTPLDVAAPDLSGLSVAQPAPAPADTGPEEATPISKFPPRYPRRAVLQGVEGWVRLEFTITKDGSVADVQVVEAKPRGYFERAARRAILRWRFRPREVNGQTKSRRAVQTIRFRLES
ncbi:MAG TPA: energy transducer TonB [Gammaproteobacteria bacterium]|nr:energy transducer TonB [Gammaproteobacteria bacterium]